MFIFFIKIQESLLKKRLEKLVNHMDNSLVVPLSIREPLQDASRACAILSMRTRTMPRLIRSFLPRTALFVDRCECARRLTEARYELDTLEKLIIQQKIQGHKKKHKRTSTKQENSPLKKENYKKIFSGKEHLVYKKEIAKQEQYRPKKTI